MTAGFNWAPPSAPRRFDRRRARTATLLERYDLPVPRWSAGAAARARSSCRCSICRSSHARPLLRGQYLGEDVHAMSHVFVLGGYQTDFARNWSKETKHISAMFNEAVERRARRDRRRPDKTSRSATSATSPPNCTRCRGTWARSCSRSTPAFSGLPTSRHEAACASGSIAMLAASAEIEAGRYDLALVRRRRADEDGRLGPRRRLPRHGGLVRARGAGISFPFPKLFGRLGDEYDKRFGLKDEHLAHIAADQLRQRQAEPARADARLVYERGARQQLADRFNR